MTSPETRRGHHPTDEKAWSPAFATGIVAALAGLSSLVAGALSNLSLRGPASQPEIQAGHIAWVSGALGLLGLAAWQARRAPSKAALVGTVLSLAGGVGGFVIMSSVSDLAGAGCMLASSVVGFHFAIVGLRFARTWRWFWILPATGWGLGTLLIAWGLVFFE